MPARDRIPVRRVSGDPPVRLLHPRQRYRGGPLKILISAAETSSDAHGAELLKALRKSAPPGVEINAFGIGGPKLEAAGLRVIVPASELLAMGFLEIVSRLPKILSALNELTAAARSERPDLAVVIDYPDFHFRLARRLKTLGVPMIYYIPPKVWVWRKGRVGLLRELFARVLCILPFEEDFYGRENVSARYVGNPLVDELPMEMSKVEAREKLGIAQDEKVLVLMPGSRPSELKRHLVLLLESVQRAVAHLRSQGVLGAKEDLKILIPVPETSAQVVADTEARAQAWISHARPGGMKVRVSRGDAALCLLAADAGAIKSGTSTLEAGILGCPHFVIYKPNALTSFVFQNFIRYKGPVGLVNLAAGRTTKPYLAREILSEEATTRNISAEIVRLFNDSKYRDEMIAGMRRLRDSLIANPAHRHPSASAASEVLRFHLEKGRA